MYKRTLLLIAALISVPFFTIEAYATENDSEKISMFITQEMESQNDYDIEQFCENENTKEVIADKLDEQPGLDETQNENIETSYDLVHYEVLEQDLVVTEIDMPDSAELFADYLNHIMYDSMSSRTEIDRRSYLSKANLKLYDSLDQQFKLIAKGEVGDSTINVSITDLVDKTLYTAEELGLSSVYGDDGNLSSEAYSAFLDRIGLNINYVISMIIADRPFEMYWFDKTYGYSVSGNSIWYGGDGSSSFICYPESTVFSIRMNVAADYSSTGNRNTTILDLSKTSVAYTSIQNAKSIVESTANDSDYVRLGYYYDRIIDLTEYNYSAANSSGNVYGDPWQIIYVFDGNPDTTVVCEGYAKAFKYLCDITSFSSQAIDCYLMTGIVDSESTYGPHMWNTVHMDDGNNYHVDVTFGDGGLYRSYFLIGADTSNSDGYVVNISGEDIYYLFDDDSRAMFSDAERNIASNNYSPSDSGQTTQGMVLYRLYNPYSGEHLYTASAEERDNIVPLGWIYEGYAWSSPLFSNAPVYRMYNPYSGDHHYTQSIEEREQMIIPGWIYEGIGFYSDENFTTPVYRLFNPYEQVGTHHYTIYESERDTMVEAGWIYEGIGWYGA